jgi:hypothetical protein
VVTAILLPPPLERLPTRTAMASPRLLSVLSLAILQLMPPAVSASSSLGAAELMARAKALEPAVRQVDEAKKSLSLTSMKEFGALKSDAGRAREAQSYVLDWQKRIDSEVSTPAFMLAGSLYLLASVPEGERGKLSSVVAWQCARVDASRINHETREMGWKLESRADPLLRELAPSTTRELQAARAQALSLSKKLGEVCEFVTQGALEQNRANR